ncbi:MAG: hypothetical protein DWQ05_01865 [Calditrichaeota bacterium]|nr:MAG: hypothetical protein DWQ05_01865 [Calditrichota bacterium]
MKQRKTIIAAAVFAFILPMMVQAGPRIYVKVKPPARKVVVVKTARPYKNAIWINGRWHWNGHKYVWKAGHWVRPKKGFVWIPGHWNHNRRGWHWIDGHWKRA